MPSYSISKTSMKSFKETVEAVKAALKQEGFGILTEIDVQQKMKEKLDKEMDEYIILGACHPPSAYKAIQLEEQVGLFLPCNVIIYRSQKGGIMVGAIRPSIAMSMISNPDLNCVAKDVEESMERVLSHI